MKKKERHSIKWKMLALVLVCWLLPFVLILGVMGYYLLTNQADNQAKQLTNQLVMNDQICGERLDVAITASRKASYDKAISDAYDNYEREIGGYYLFYTRGQSYIREQYGNQKAFAATVLWLYDDPQKLNCSIYNERTGGSFDQINTYWESDHEAVKETAESLGTSIGFVYREGRLYMVRNLVDKHYRPWGVLLMRLNMNYCFEPLANFMEQMAVKMNFNGTEVVLQGKAKEFKEMPRFEDSPKGTYEFGRDNVYIYHTLKKNDYSLTSVLAAPTGASFSPFYGYRYVIIGMILFLIPILFLLWNMFRRHIDVPVNAMMDGAREIEKGELGHQLDYPAKSQEFQYLKDSFNHMSSQLKYQFDHIYEEELALRDARIMALQSHINPHFMNNTLEIINWEARMEGNIKVSKMIEALSTLMDAAIDRKKRPEVTLAEEMRYVDSYLYISAERLGKRLIIEKDINEELMECLVPRLILQPVIENAIEHGVVPQGRGTVCIRGYREGRYLYLEIENDGTMTEKEEQTIKRLLDPEYDTSKESSGNMGIANVNQRLRILYGEECGLSLFRSDENHITARLTIDGNI